MPEEQERSLDEAEVECHLPREDESPPVARTCDARAGQHPARRHPDELPPNAAAQDDAVAKNLNVIKRHPVRAIHHDRAPPVWLGGSGGRRVQTARPASSMLRSKLASGVDRATPQPHP